MATTQSLRRRLRFRPRKSVIYGASFGVFFTVGYVVNSFFYCQSQFACAVSPVSLAVVVLVGTAIGALVGWLVGRFFRFIYRVTRVD